MADALTKLGLSILKQFSKDLEKGYTINGLAKEIKKPYPNVHRTIKQLLEEKLLVKEIIGHSHYCRLNLQNDAVLLYVSLLQKLKGAALIEENPKLKALLKRFDTIEGILLVWKRTKDILVVAEDTNILKKNTLVNTITQNEFVSDKDLVLKTVTDTLIYGHAKYPSVLREVFQ